MPKSSPAFVYSPVKAWQFRVLELFPGPRHTGLQGRLVLATIVMQASRQVAISVDDGYDDITEIAFRALSYTWGSSGQGNVILLGGRQLPITANLHLALTELRELESEEPNLIWADAICIDQGSSKEKSEQVANMLQIYQVAELVEVWLGGALDNSDLAMTFLKRLADPLFDVADLSKPHTQQCIRSAETHLWPSLLNICSRAWLRRTWVRQEVYAARSLTVRCGSCTTTWQSFLKGFSVLWLLTSLLPDADLDGRALAAIRLLPELHANSAAAPGLSLAKASRNLVDVLFTSQEYLVTEKRDTVFAILGMCGARISTAWRSQNQNRQNSIAKTTSIVIDYEKDLSEIWSNVTYYVLAEAALEEPDRDDAKEISRRNEEISQYQGTFEGSEMVAGDVVDRYQSHIADMLNVSNCSITGTLTANARKHSENPAWSLEWLVARSTEENAAFRSIQVPRGGVNPLRWCERSLGVLPSPKPKYPATLQLRGIVYGYVAGIEDLTCDVSHFIAAVESRQAKVKHVKESRVYDSLQDDRKEVEEAKKAVEDPERHCRNTRSGNINWEEVDKQRQKLAKYKAREQANVAKLREVHGPLSVQDINTRPFVAAKSDRRLGYITTFERDLGYTVPQVALLPSSARAGDLVACGAMNVLPLVIRPLSDTAPGQLVKLREWMRTHVDFDDVHRYHDEQHWQAWLPFQGRPTSSSPSSRHSEALKPEWNRRKTQFCKQVPKDHLLIGSAPFHQWLYSSQDYVTKDFLLH